MSYIRADFFYNTYNKSDKNCGLTQVVTNPFPLSNNNYIHIQMGKLYAAYFIQHKKKKTRTYI